MRLGAGRRRWGWPAWGWPWTSRSTTPRRDAGGPFRLGSHRPRLDQSGPAATALGTVWVGFGASLRFHRPRGSLRPEGSAPGLLGKIGAPPGSSGTLRPILVPFVSRT
ncbi:MAG TPA: hypothetical protein VKP69_34220 [Isosphaeraceae bacterium]|nr:hypothetical protein [Isosphaeraceae bacterium]